MGKRKTRIISTMMLIIVLSLTGCGNAIPEMTQEQERLVVEYAMTTLLKYDTNHQGKIVELSQMEVEAPHHEQIDQGNMVITDEQEPSELPTTENGDAITEDTEPMILSAEELLGLPNVSLEYTGYEVVDRYPQNGEEIYFAMNASEGSQLLVMKFTLCNLLPEEQMVVIQPGSVRLKMIVNGKEKNVLTTMLLNDLGAYQETLGANESVEVVAVGEFKTEELEKIETLELKMKANENEILLTCS